MRVLIIEDDPLLAELLVYGLEDEGFSADICETGHAGLRFALENVHDLILLDRMLPGMPGEDVLRRIREKEIFTPVIFITALGDSAEKIDCLDIGADDYLVKPFDMGELMARIRCIMRRVSNNPTSALKFGDLEFSEKEAKLVCRGETLILSRKEADLLSYFFRHSNQVLSRWEIIGNVWGPDTDVEDGNLDNYIYLLRKKLKKLNTSVQITTIHRQGYRLVEKILIRKQVFYDQKVHKRLALICGLITTGIVLVIILICLYVSEQNMYREEEALFILKGNSISFDITSAKTVDMSWYAKNFDNRQDNLYIEINGRPSPLTSVLLSDEEQARITRIKAYQVQAEPSKITDVPLSYSPSLPAAPCSFEYREGKDKFMVMSLDLTNQSSKIRCLYIHSLAKFRQKIIRQRIYYFFIWLFSLVVLYVFSYYFTAQAIKPLIKNQEKQKQFVSLASHELRSPLAVFKTGLSLLKTAPSPERSARIHSMLDEEIGRMERLLNDLLFLSKAEQAALPYQFEKVRLSELLTSVYGKYRSIACEREITLSVEPAKAPMLSCVCDRQRIEQVVIILLDNALTYTPAGGHVSLSLDSSHGKCLIFVRDTGTGISDCEKEKIFDRFYQANASHNNKAHFGLGLSIAKEICKAHNGSLKVEDTPGGGSTFIIKLPINH